LGSGVCEEGGCETRGGGLREKVEWGEGDRRGVVKEGKAGPEGANMVRLRSTKEKGDKHGTNRCQKRSQDRKSGESNEKKKRGRTGGCQSLRSGDLSQFWV